jgi:urea carboxylase/allophanate hydrolase
LVPIDLAAAYEQRDAVETSVLQLAALKPAVWMEHALPLQLTLPDAAVFAVAGRCIRCRPAGDRAVLIEFGYKDGFDLGQTFHIAAFLKRHQDSPMTGVEELTTGVRSILMSIRSRVTYAQVIEEVKRHEESLGDDIATNLPSRIIKMPLVFNDQQSQAAVARYQSTIRSSAPYLPSNIDFLRDLNGLTTTDELSNILSAATFLVLGLGDVYKGSPCAVALDPRHRLFGTKYNPSRSFTPAGAVGIAGQYLCIYAMDSPGGYQLVGRTVPIWKSIRETTISPQQQDMTAAVPWLFRLLDQIVFYPIAESDLAAAEAAGDCKSLVHITETTLDLPAYEKAMEQVAENAAKVKALRETAVQSFSGMDQLLRPYEPTSSAAESDAHDRNDDNDSCDKSRGEYVRAQLPGKCFQICVHEGDEVRKGDVIVSEGTSSVSTERLRGTETNTIIGTYRSEQDGSGGVRAR